MDAIVTTDVHGRVTYWSPGAEELSGYRAEEMLGQRSADYYQGGLQEAQAIMQRLRAEGHLRNHEMAIRLKAGGWMAASSSISLLRNASGAVVGTLAVYKDVTEHKRAEEALRESEERYRTLFAESRDAIVVNRPTGEFIDFNQAALDLFGYTRDELARLKAQDLYVDPGIRDRFRQEIERTGAVQDFALTCRRKDGAEIDCLLTSTAWQARDGKILGYQGIIRDITEHKRAQEELRLAKEAAEEGRQLVEQLYRLAISVQTSWDTRGPAAGLHPRCPRGGRFRPLLHPARHARRLAFRAGGDAR